MCENAPKIGYSCAFVPYRALQKLGFKAVMLSDRQSTNKGVENNLSRNLCSYVLHCERIVHDIDLDAIVFTNCCNSSQRLYDLVRSQLPHIKCWLLEVPRSNSDEDLRFFRSNQVELINEIHDTFFANPPETSLEELLSHEIEVEDLAKGTIYVLGACLSPNLIAELQHFLPSYSLQVNLCNTRTSANPCARMSDFVPWFNSLIEKNQDHLEGMIYISSQNCDHFLFNYPLIKSICERHHLPLLGFEQNFANYSAKQIEVRVEAFVENLAVKKTRLEAGTISQPNATNNAEADKTFRQRMRLVRGIIPGLPLNAVKKVVENQSELFSQTIWEQPERIVWTNMVMPLELFYAADLIPVNTELIAGWLASTGLARSYLSESEGLGFSSSLCSYHKSALGLIARGGLPAPRGMAIQSHICDGQPGLAHYLREQYQTDIFLLNTPFHRTSSNRQFLIDQFDSFQCWIEHYTGKPLSRDKIEEAFEYSNTARRYWREAFAIRKGDPVFPGHLSLRNLFGATFLFGSALGVDVSKLFLEDLQQRHESDTSNLPPGKRILWIHFAPLYDNHSMDYLETTLKCWIVMDITGHIYWDELDPGKPFDSLADKCLSHFYLGESSERIKLYADLIREYKIDGVIHFMHNGCRAIPGGSWQIRNLASDMGIPYLEISGDCIDPRGASKSQLHLRFEAFSESLNNR